jgi:Sensors of blue-light using FAD
MHFGGELSVHQLIYASQATPEVTGRVLLDMQIRAQDNNSKLEISGILIFHHGAFIQLLEGSEKNVKELFAAISKDPRHTNVQINFEKDSYERLMPSWFMGFSTSEVLPMNEICDQSFRIPIEETRQLCELMQGEIGNLFRSFLKT